MSSVVHSTSTSPPVFVSLVTRDPGKAVGVWCLASINGARPQLMEPHGHGTEGGAICTALKHIVSILEPFDP